MIAPLTPTNEAQRLQALVDLNILDSSNEEDYDNITELASFICDTPVALISLVDENRQWFKAKVGIEACETEREYSFCAHAILKPDEILEINDATTDIRFIDNPLTQLDRPVIFYAGVPLLDENGMPLGSLCVIDHKPNALDDKQRTALKRLGKQVEKLFLLRTLNGQLINTRESIVKHNGLLKEFAGIVSHDLKMPLANLILTSDILKKMYGSLIDEKGVEYLDYLKKSSLTMSSYITKILEHYESSAYDRDDADCFQINDMLENVIDLLDIKHNCEVLLPEDNMEIECNRTALKQIFINLIGNSLKYNDKDNAVIQIKAAVSDSLYTFTIHDNGRGIEEDKLETIFVLFKTVGHLDKYGEKGNGIGLSTVQKIIESLGGTISVNSKLGVYTEIVFTIGRAPACN